MNIPSTSSSSSSSGTIEGGGEQRRQHEEEEEEEEEEEVEEVEVEQQQSQSSVAPAPTGTTAELQFYCDKGKEIPDFSFAPWYQTFKELKEVGADAEDSAKAIAFKKIWNHLRSGLPRIKGNPKTSNAWSTSKLLNLCSNRDMEVVLKMLKSPEEMPGDQRIPLHHKTFNSTKSMGVKKIKENLRLLEVRLHPDTTHWSKIFDELDGDIRRAHTPIGSATSALQEQGYTIHLPTPIHIITALLSIHKKLSSFDVVVVYYKSAIIYVHSKAKQLIIVIRISKKKDSF